MDNKRIILIRNAMQYDFGGGERFPVFLAEILQQSGFQPLIISRSKKLLVFAADTNIRTIRGWWWSRQNWSGARNALLPVYLAWQCILFFWYLQLFLRYRPAAVHIQSKDDFIAATLAAKMQGARIIWTDHADLKHIWRNITIWYKNPIGKLVHFAAKFTDHITLVSKSELSLVGGHLRKDSSVRQKLTVIYNGVFDANNRYPGIAHKKFTFCVASRLVTDKGIGEAIAAFKRVVHEHPESQLIFLGDGPEAATFKEQAAGVDSIKFAGHQKDPLKYMASADVFVHPTYHEGFSVALVEASMLGKPIVATSVGGNVEIIYNNKTGLLVEERNIDRLYGAMQKLITNADLRDTLGEAARQQYLERFNFKLITTKYFIPLYEGENYENTR